MTFDNEPNDDFPDETTALTGRVVVDARLEKVGTVTDVIFDDREGAARWAVVKGGPLRVEHFVPLDGSYVDLDGRLVVGLEKTDVRRSPRARRDHLLTSEARRELRDYYGIAA